MISVALLALSETSCCTTSRLLIVSCTSHRSEREILYQKSELQYQNGAGQERKKTVVRMRLVSVM